MLISVITYCELLNGLLFKDARAQLNRFEQFVQLNQVLPKNNQVIGHNDVLIGATAIEHDLILITNNTNHFARIPDLSIDNWVG